MSSFESGLAIIASTGLAGYSVSKIYSGIRFIHDTNEYERATWESNIPKAKEITLKYLTRNINNKNREIFISLAGLGLLYSFLFATNPTTSIIAIGLASFALGIALESFQRWQSSMNNSINYAQMWLEADYLQNHRIHPTILKLQGLSYLDFYLTTKVRQPARQELITRLKNIYSL